MCGRYATSRSAADLAAVFDAEPEPEVAEVAAPRYNVAPTDEVPVVRLTADSGGRVLSAGRWGLLPHWQRDPRAGAKMINARSETVATSRAFAGPFARRRALVPADGWYEWRRADGAVQPYFMTAGPDGLAFAGIWQPWGPHRVPTFAVVTTAAVGDLAAVHDRMPLVLEPDRWEEWLTADPAPELLRPPAPGWLAGLELRPVGRAVGNVRNDGPDLVERAPAAADRLF